MRQQVRKNTCLLKNKTYTGSMKFRDMGNIFLIKTTFDVNSLFLGLLYLFEH